MYIKAPIGKYKTQEEYEEAALVNFEKALKKFKKQVQRENILVYYRRHTYYIPKGEVRREKKKKGRIRHLKRKRREELKEED